MEMYILGIFLTRVARQWQETVTGVFNFTMLLKAKGVQNKNS
jgi:hypothetical protein